MATKNKGEIEMTDHKTATRAEWRAARLELLEAEKALTRRGDELARWRRELPWVPVDKDYRFETEQGPASLADLFNGRSQLLVYHFMFGPDYTAGCPACSSIADGFDGFARHLENHDVMLWGVSRAPFPKIRAYRRRMGWRFPWASSFGSEFNYDFQAAMTEAQQQSGASEYNFRVSDMRPAQSTSDEPATSSRDASLDNAMNCGTDWPTYMREMPGMSSFVLEDDAVYHTYSAYARGLDGLWGMYQWLDRSPRGRNESGLWFRRHDEYETS
jgi:predicted dithiol-disulfide oxidoreductase (DUF899 family)